MKLTPVTQRPKPGDVVYHENQGLVKYRVTEDDMGSYQEFVIVQVMEDMGDGYYKPGHLSCREWKDLLKEELN